MRAHHSTRMENLELNQDSERTVRDSFPIMAQDPRSGIQEKMRAQHSTRMENLELNQNSERTVRDSFPTMAQDPRSGMQEKMRAQHSTRLEEIEREIDHDEQDMDPPGLTDSEDEEESEEETEEEQHLFQPSRRTSVKKIKQHATLDEERIPREEGKSEDAAKKTGRAPKEELGGGQRSRDNGVVLPKLIESDKDSETEDEEED